jgi:uncharacterized protein DUF2442
MIPWKVTGIAVLPGYRLDVTFADGTAGIVDLSGESFDGVFAPFADPAFFAQARIQDGVVVWPNGADIAPDAMYDEILSRTSPMGGVSRNPGTG